MTHESVIRLPGRLVSVVRTDAAAAEATIAAIPPPHVPPPPDLRPEREAIERVLETLRQAAKQLQSRQQTGVEEMRQITVELAMAVAGRFLQERLDSGTFSIEPLVRQVLARLEPRRPVTVAIHPEDLALLKKQLGDIGMQHLTNQEVRLIGDASLRRGDCQGQAGDIRVWIDLEGQLAALRKRLLESAAE